MSHQTGIRANAQLEKAFGSCHSEGCRALKIVIDHEQLVLDKRTDSSADRDWEADFDGVVRPLIVDDSPCFILYRLDTKNSLGYEWLLISWSPDTAPVRQKMLYASTKATLKSEFGSAHLKDELYCNTKEDATLAGYGRHLRGETAPAPLTEGEMAMRTLSLTEHGSDYGPDSKQQTLGGVAFPLSPEGYEALSRLSEGVHNYLRFEIDLDKETIRLSKSCTVSVKDLPAQIPTDAARYHMFIFRHTHEGDVLESIVFIYSMPGYNCGIKERMLYSSCKSPFLDVIEKMGIEVTKKLEIDDGKELTEEYLYDEIHPKRNLHRPAFAKPKGPPNRGAKRITKPQAT